MYKKKPQDKNKPLFTARTFSTSEFGIEPRQYIPPAKVKINHRNTRATSQNAQDETVRLRPQL